MRFTVRRFRDGLAVCAARGLPCAVDVPGEVVVPGAVGVPGEVDVPGEVVVPDEVDPPTGPPDPAFGVTVT